MPVTQKEFEVAYQKANQKDAAAQYVVGQYYLEQKNSSHAKHWFTQAAEQGNNDAQFGLAELLLKESGDSALLKAAALLIKVTNKHEAVKKYLCEGGVREQLGKLAEKKQPKHQFIYYSNADSSAAEAHHLLGQIYINELFGQKDITVAIKHYQQSFELGNLKAGKELGIMHYEGSVIPKSYPDALHVFRSISDRFPTDIDALFFLGCLHENYTSIKDNTKAIQYYEQSSTRRGRGAVELTRLYYDKYSNEKQEWQKAQYKSWIMHYARASDIDKNSQNYLGIIYYNDKQYLEAAAWFSKSDAQGLSSATYNLALAYKDDKCGKDKTKLLTDLMKKAAEKGHSSAQYELADYYKSGKYGFPTDLLEAFIWMQKAADQNHEKAKAELGDDKNVLYPHKKLNDSVKRDTEKFKVLIRLQIKLGYSFSNPQYLITAFDRTRDPARGEAVYQRYEFLGDAALSFVIASYLEEHAPKEIPTAKIHEMQADMIANKTILPLNIGYQ